MLKFGGLHFQLREGERFRKREQEVGKKPNPKQPPISHSRVPNSRRVKTTPGFIPLVASSESFIINSGVTISVNRYCLRVIIRGEQLMRTICGRLL